MTRAEIYAAIDAQRLHQNAKHPQPLGAMALAVLMEEVGEVAEKVQAASDDWGLPEDLRAELIQVAAVAVRWLEEMGE